jgi:O-antigen/teichoic acid export membrane protein
MADAVSEDRSLDGASDASTLAVGGALRLTSTAIGVVGGLVVTVVVFRGLGTPSFGTYALALSVCSVIAIVAELGIGVGVARMSAYLDADRARSWAGTALMIAIASGGLLTALTIAAASLVSGPLRLALIVAAPLILVGTVSSVSRGFLSARRRLARSEVITIVTQLLSYAAAITVVALGSQSPVVILASQVVVRAIGALLLGFVCYREIRTLPVGPLTRARDVVAFSTPLMMGGVAGTILQRSDVIMVGVFIGLGAVGWYEPTLRVLDVAPVAMAALGYYFFSVGASMVRRDQTARLRDAYATITKWGLVLTMPLLMTLLVAPVPFLRAIFGSDLHPQAVVVTVLAVGYIVNIAAGVNGGALAVLGATKTILVRSIALVVLNLAGNAILIPVLGVLGGAIATTAVLVALNAVNAVLVWRMARLTPFREDTVRCFAMIATATALGWASARALGLQNETVGAVIVLALASASAVAAALLNLRPGELRLVHDLAEAIRIRVAPAPSRNAVDGLG